jgi:hypothetical protein
MADYDSPWKEALELYFRAFLLLFFPRIHADIDWSRRHVFLDKELQALLLTDESGRLYVDKLVKVWRKDGREAWVLIHVEVQTTREAGFPARMYRYNTRIASGYNRNVVSLAVLADDDAGWRPDRYEADVWGWSVRMAWPAVKLLDYAARRAELERSKNPFAHVVLAHLTALETRNDPRGRRAWKFRLVRGLYERGLRKEDMRQLLRLIDWLVDLPPRLQADFLREVDEYVEGQTMPYVTSWGREAMFELIEISLREKFGDEVEELLDPIHELNDAEKYKDLMRQITRATTLDEVRRACVAAGAPVPRRKKGGNGKRGSKA